MSQPFKSHAAKGNKIQTDQRPDSAWPRRPFLRESRSSLIGRLGGSPHFLFCMPQERGFPTLFKCVICTLIPTIEVLLVELSSSRAPLQRDEDSPLLLEPCTVGWGYPS